MRRKMKKKNNIFPYISGRQRNVHYEKPSFYTDPAELEFNEKGGISLMKGHRIVSLNSETQEASLDDGRIIKYHKCLIATGGTPKTLQCLKDFTSNVTTFRSLSDYEKLDQLTSSGKIKSIAVIGGGFLGSEITCSLALKGKEEGFSVTQILPQKGPLSKVHIFVHIDWDLG